jgi:hypothetical protein
MFLIDQLERPPHSIRGSTMSQALPNAPKLASALLRLRELFYFWAE